jgi:serine phosphatase RsbU (regulator of sigma subunit)
VLTRHLQPGSLLIMVTDGVVESRRHDIDHGISLLRDRAADLRHATLKELVQGIAALADTTMHDDVTVLASRLR